MTGPGGLSATLGTNPLSIAAPAHAHEVFCLNMATSQVSWGQLRATQATTGQLCLGWAADAD